jgi:putative DNA methylase
MPDDLRLIEDYLPIEAISKEASREKSVRKGHISTLHLWWARRPLVACRAAVYGALVPADRWVKDVDVKNPPADAAKAEAFKNGAKRGLNRKAAKEFVTKLCRYPKTNPTKPLDIKIKRETEQAIADAQKHILEAHADRLTEELRQWKAGKTTTDSTDKKTKSDSSSSHPCHPCDPWSDPSAPSWVREFKFQADKVTYEDILAGRAPRPRVLDMFAGGGAIPLEALRLGCEAYALDLNPVAHIIQLCTLVYPQKYGKPDPTARGMTGPKNASGETTWGGLAVEVRHWGNWVLDRVRKEIGDLYPLIPDPEHKKSSKTEAKAATKKGATGEQMKMHDEVEEELYEVGAAIDVPPGYLMPVAYLWTRTVRCKNPACAASVPLVRQTWLCKKPGRYIALKPVAPRGKKRVRFDMAQSETEAGLGFDPEGFSTAGNSTCPFCGTVADSDYAKSEGCAARLSLQLMAIVCIQPGREGKTYLSADEIAANLIPDERAIESRLRALSKNSELPRVDELIEINPRSMDVDRWGLTRFGDLFTLRQQLSLLSFSAAVRDAAKLLVDFGYSQETAKAVVALLAANVDKQADRNSQICVLLADGGRGIKNTFARQALPMTWDFAEANPFNQIIASWASCFREVIGNINDLMSFSALGAQVSRGSATDLPWEDSSFDAVITDPPYYDNVSYSNLSDFFYVWLKRSIGQQFPEHFATALTPKKAEVIAAFYRHGGSKEMARRAYEDLMGQSLSEAHRVLKPNGQLAVVYAHKTTLGWSTLVEALRKAGFTVMEAWPLDTETRGRLVAQNCAALASSIFLVARKRDRAASIGNYEDDVQPELQQIVRERVETLWDMGITGADLVIAAVGAGLRAFTKYEKVEYANGEEVPAEKFLAEVEGVVLDTMMGKLSGVVGGNVSAVDNASRFYVLWRFVYKAAELDAGEAIIFANGTHIELDGPRGLSSGQDALVEKKKAKYRMRDFTERGNDAKLGLPGDGEGKTGGQPAPLIDALHRILWLMDNSPRKLNEFLDEARPDRERLRVLAQALAGAALSGKSEEESAKLVSTTPAEQAALGKLLANWRSLIESRLAAEEGGLFGKKS